MKQVFLKITENKKIAKDVWLMKLEGDVSAITASGQFVNIKLDGFYLRRPISVCDYNDSTITLIYKVVGAGTEIMSTKVAGEKFDILVGLGNGYNTDKSGETPLLIGGGVGVPPMYGLCKKLVAEGKKPTVILGFNTADEIFYNPRHEYTKGLLRSIPTTNTFGQKLKPITGTPIDLLNMPKGCPFAPRCDAAMKICIKQNAERMLINDDHAAACWMNVKKGIEDGTIEIEDKKDGEAENNE